jgi:hypothetical protein
MRGQRDDDLNERGFVLEVGGRPVVALIADSFEQARRLCTECWFTEDLASFKSNGHPVWDGSATLNLRRADQAEVVEIEIALMGERARQEYEGFLFVFFVPIDPALH